MKEFREVSSIIMGVAVLIIAIGSLIAQDVLPFIIALISFVLMEIGFLLLWILKKRIEKKKLMLAERKQYLLDAAIEDNLDEDFYTIEDIDDLPGLDFEHVLGKYFERDGYKVEVTKGSGDYGADLILEKDEIRIIVQAKRFEDKVNLKAVQEIVAAKPFYHADKCMVITNNYYHNSAKNLAEANGVTLWDRRRLKRFLDAQNAVLREIASAEVVTDDFDIDYSEYEVKTKTKHIMRITSIVLFVLSLVFISISFVSCNDAYERHSRIMARRAKRAEKHVEETYETTTQPKPTESEAIEYVNMKSIEIVSAESDSYYKSKKEYTIDLTYDGLNETCWQDGSDGDAIGEHLTYHFEANDLYVISIVNGNRLRSDSYYENNRFKTVTATFYLDGEDVYELVLIFEDDPADVKYHFKIPSPVYCDCVDLRIDEVYAGSKYSETACSEIVFLTK